MHSNIATLETRLSASMLKTLNEVYENEELKLPPLDATKAPSGKGLLLRGMIEIKPWYNKEGKKIMSLFITKKGIEYIRQPGKNIRKIQNQ